MAIVDLFSTIPLIRDSSRIRSDLLIVKRIFYFSSGIYSRLNITRNSRDCEYCGKTIPVCFFPVEKIRRICGKKNGRNFIDSPVEKIVILLVKNNISI